MRKKRSKILTKWDIILASAVVAVCVAGYFFTGFFLAGNEKYAVIEVDGKIFAKYNMTTLTETKYVDVNGHNTIEITRDYVKSVYADCKDRLDIKQGKITDPGQIIICMPNRMTVRITGKSRLDAVAY